MVSLPNLRQRFSRKAVVTGRPSAQPEGLRSRPHACGCVFPAG